MARTPTDNSKDTSTTGPSREDEILMREIDEAVRQDDAKEFLQKYGVPLGAGLLLLLAGMIGYWWWDSSNEAALEADSEAVVSALDSVDAGDFAGAGEKVAGLLDSDNVGARTTARMLQAAAALEQDNPDEAVELYATIVADTEAPQPLRDLALIREISTDFDNREPADTIAKLAPLAVPGNPFFGSAGELTAIAHLEAGNREEAGMLFSQIAKDEDMPDSLRERSRQMAGLLGVDTIDDVDQLLEDQGVVAPPPPQ
ncbi:MAG: tetratricopeptide repeat protein [Erythrobacter sp.]